MQKRAAIAALSILVLASCGGGNDSEPVPEPTPVPTPVPEPEPTPVPEVAPPTPKAGLFIAKDLRSSIGWDTIVDRFHQLTLENGESWIIDHIDASGTPEFFAQGTFTLSYQASGIAPWEPWPWTNVTRSDRYKIFKDSAARIATGSTALQSSLLEIVETHYDADSLLETVFHPAAYSGARSERGIKFSVEPGRSFDYNQPARVSEIQGAWVFYNPGRKVPHATLEVASTGTFAGGNAATGCSFSGTLVPRPSGKNVFNAQVTLTACADAGAYSGVAYTFSSLPDSFGSAAVPVLKLMALSTDKTRVFNLQMTPAPKG